MMKESEFKALISLLDDDDPGVGEHIESRLLAMGVAVVPRLEQAWEEEESEVIQERIEDIIQIIQHRETIDELKVWIKDPEGSLLRGWFLVTRYLYPEIDYKDWKNEVNRLVNKIWLEFRSGMRLSEKLATINSMIFKRERYRPNRKTLLDPDGYLLNRVIETHRGSPLALCLLYAIVSQELEIKLDPILLPGYTVLVYRDEEDNEFFVDVFNMGAVFLRKDLQRFMEREKLNPKPEFFEPTGRIDIIKKLIGRLRESFNHKKQPDKARHMLLLLENLED